jgi:hypothetical protein
MAKLLLLSWLFNDADCVETMARWLMNVEQLVEEELTA